MKAVDVTRQNYFQRRRRRFGWIVGATAGSNHKFRLLKCVLSLLAVSLPYFSGTTAFSTPTKLQPNVIGIPISTSLNFATAGHEIDEPAAKLRAAVYQAPISDDKAAAASVSESKNPLKVLTEVADVLQLAARCGIDLVQFPELFLNGGLFEDVVDGKSAPLDRESYALNIIGNLCAELNVACIMGYAESRHESEGRALQAGNAANESLADSNGGCCCYSSLAIFHADGSRAGNYRCVHPPYPWIQTGANKLAFGKGHPLVEAMPISVQLPARPPAPTLQESIKVQEEETTTTTKTKTAIPREVKVGAMCGGDLLVPEHARYLARLGAEMFVVSGSLLDETGSRMAKHVVPTRSMENELPLLFSNYVENQKDEYCKDAPTSFFVGQSSILSSDGAELVRAPEHLDGDMPGDEGYFLPCETGGALFAADLNICANESNGIRSIDASINDWDIAPRIDQLDGRKKGDTKGNEKGFRKERDSKSKGFGREVMEVLEQSKKRKLRLKNS